MNIPNAKAKAFPIYRAIEARHGAVVGYASAPHPDTPYCYEAIGGPEDASDNDARVTVALFLTEAEANAFIAGARAVETPYGPPICEKVERQGHWLVIIEEQDRGYLGSVTFFTPTDDNPDNEPQGEEA